MDLFASRGFKGATTRAIAQAAGVSEAIIFRHFANKEDLYDAIITTSIEKREEIWESETPLVEQGIAELMGEYARGVINRNRQDQTFIRLMLYSALEDHKFRQKFFESHRSPYLRIIRERIQTGVESGEFRKTDSQLTMMSFFFTLLQYSVNRFVASSETPTEEADQRFIDNLISVYVTSLKTPTSASAAAIV